MAPKKQGLGKGLGSLLGDMNSLAKIQEVQEVSAEEAKTARMIRLRDIEPNRNQPRRNFSEEELQELADSVRTYGIITPLILVKEDKHYMIIAGERRWRAAKLAGLKEVPAVIREYSEREIAEISLVENIQRSDLNPLEEAEAFDHLMKAYNLTQEELSDRIGKSRSSIANALRLLKLPDEVREYVICGNLSQGHAKAILGLESEDKIPETAKLVIDQELSVRETEQLVKKLNMNKPEKPAKKALKNQVEYTNAENDLAERLQTKVRINRKSENAGRIEIEFYSLEDIERILRHIN